MWLMTMTLIALDHRLFSVRAGICTHFHISKAKMFFSTHHILKIKDVFVRVYSLVSKALNNMSKLNLNIFTFSKYWIYNLYVILKE